MREAERCRETGEAKTILFGLTGTGYFDMVAYDRFNRGEMEDHVPSDEELEAGFATIPSVPGVQQRRHAARKAPSSQDDGAAGGLSTVPTRRSSSGRARTTRAPRRAGSPRSW